MHKNNSNGKLSAVITIILFFVSSLVLYSSIIPQIQAQEEYAYTYYGYVPAKMYAYNLTEPNQPPSDSNPWQLDTATPSRAAVVAVVGIEDDTHVRISYLDGVLVSEATINKIQKHYVIFPNDTSFKVETSKLASVLLLNYGAKPLNDEDIATYQNNSQAITAWAQACKNMASYPLPFTFYQSVDGAYVGTEFVLMAVQWNIYQQYTIFALESSTITVTREDGQERSYSLEVNKWVRPIWEPFMTYQIESTGNIMIHSGNIAESTFFVPSAEGGFVGTNFYSLSISNFDTTESYGFRASAAQDSQITVWNLETQTQILTADITAGSGLGFKPNAPAILVQSNHPITLEYIHNGSITQAVSDENYGAYGSGLGYFGVKPDDDTLFYLPVNAYVQAYIFASEDTNIVLDGITRPIPANSFFLLTQPGTHTIISDKKVVVETLNWPNTPDYQGLQFPGAQIPSIQTVDVVPNVTLTPLGEGFPIMYIAIGVAVAAIAVIAIMLIMRGRGKKQP